MSAPFDDLKALLASLPAQDEVARAAAAEALARQGRFGRLGEAAEWLAAWQGRGAPRVRRPIVALYAAAQAGAAEPLGAVKARLESLAGGEGAVSLAARDFGAGVEVFDLAVDRPSADPVDSPAMSERECAATFAFGMEALAKGPDLLILGDIAGGSERAAQAIALALFGHAVGERGAAGDWPARAVARARGEGAQTPLDLLRHLGGRETAALAGAIVAARMQAVPVILDGYAAAAAGAVLQALRADALDHCQAADAGGTDGHRRLLTHLGKRPLVDLDIAPSGGLAGVAALGLLRAACALQAGG